VVGLQRGDDVAADDLDVRIGGLDVLDHLQLVDRVTLGIGIVYDEIMLM
jgi:hypothetical protein